MLEPPEAQNSFDRFLKGFIDCHKMHSPSNAVDGNMTAILTPKFH